MRTKFLIPAIIAILALAVIAAIPPSQPPKAPPPIQPPSVIKREVSSRQPPTKLPEIEPPRETRVSYNVPKSPQETRNGNHHSAPNKIPGWKVSGKLICVGINYGGSLGRGQKDVDPDTWGFQFPPGYQYECLAFSAWVDGWKLEYTVGGAKKLAYWYPSKGWPPPAACNIFFRGYKIIESTPDVFIVETYAETRDLALKITFRWVFHRNFTSVMLRTTIMSHTTVSDIRYARGTDWDIHTVTTNFWVTRGPNCAEAKYYNASLEKWILCGVKGYPCCDCITMDIDLWGWDDYYRRGMKEVYKDYSPVKADYFSVIWFNVCRDLQKGESVSMIYEYYAGWAVRAPP